MILLFILLTSPIDSVINQPEFGPAQVGIYILNLNNDSLFYEHNSTKLFVPASNMKLVTTGAALYFLGSDYRFKTRLALRGKVKGDKLAGDVLVIGGGDPVFSLDNLAQFVSTIIGMRIKEIAGDIIVVDDYFTEERLPTGWAWHYLDARYASEISALSMNNNCVNVRLEATKVGEYARVTIEPETKYVKLINNMKTKAGSDSIIIYRKPEANIIYTDGWIGVNSIRNIQVAVKDPAMFVGNYFAEVLNDSGIRLKGRVIKSTASMFDTIAISDFVVDSVISRPLIDIIKQVNTESINLYAEILIKTLGAYCNSEGSFSAGLQAVKRFLAICGVDTNMVSLADGSGLSRNNLISPYDFVSVLKYLYHSPFFEDMYALLPVPGQGTLKNRFKDFVYEIHAKTGTIFAVSCLSGYLRINGTLYGFSMMFNNFICTSEQIKQSEERILAVLAETLVKRDERTKIQKQAK